MIRTALEVVWQLAACAAAGYLLAIVGCLACEATFTVDRRVLGAAIFVTAFDTLTANLLSLYERDRVRIERLLAERQEES